MPRMLGDFSEIHCSSKIIWTLWWHVTNMIEIHWSVTAVSVYARYCSFRTHNFFKIIYTYEVNLITTAFINFVSGKSTAYCCSEWWFEQSEIPCWWRNWYQHYRWTWGGYKTLAIEGCWCVFEVPMQAPKAMHVHLMPNFSRSLYSVTRCAQKSILVFKRILSYVFNLVLA